MQGKRKRKYKIYTNAATYNYSQVNIGYTV